MCIRDRWDNYWTRLSPSPRRCQWDNYWTRLSPSPRTCQWDNPRTRLSGDSEPERRAQITTSKQGIKPHPQHEENVFPGNKGKHRKISALPGGKHSTGSCSSRYYAWHHGEENPAVSQSNGGHELLLHIAAVPTGAAPSHALGRGTIIIIQIVSGEVFQKTSITCCFHN